MKPQMVVLDIDGQTIEVVEGTTLLEAARFLGIEIPTLCSMEGLSPYGACRLCIVEIGPKEKPRVVSSCTYPCVEGLEVRTVTPALLESRKMLLELMVSSTPGSKVIQDMASAMGVSKQRFRREKEDCVLCGLCVRMCKEQMMSGAIDFAGRGPDRRIATPFEIPSELCRHCGGCMYVCPACQLRCGGAEADTALCSGCIDYLSCGVLETIEMSGASKHSNRRA